MLSDLQKEIADLKQSKTSKDIVVGSVEESRILVRAMVSKQEETNSKMVATLAEHGNTIEQMVNSIQKLEKRIALIHQNTGTVNSRNHYVVLNWAVFLRIITLCCSRPLSNSSDNNFLNLMGLNKYHSGL